MSVRAPVAVATGSRAQMFAMPVQTAIRSLAPRTSAAVENDSFVPKPSGNQRAP